MDDSVLEDQLEHALQELIRLERPVAHRLQPGLPIDVISQHLKAFPFEVPDEVIKLYRWRNGTRSEPGDILNALNFFPGFVFVSIEEALGIIRSFEGLSPWRTSWFPLFEDCGGDYLAVESADSPFRRGQIIRYAHGDSEQYAVYEQLATMMQTIATCYERGAYFVNVDGYLVVSCREALLIGRELNPDLEYYNKELAILEQVENGDMPETDAP